MLETVLLQNKAELDLKRRELKISKFTECRLEHRTQKGLDEYGKEATFKYELTYYHGILSELDLVQMGFKKMPKKKKLEEKVA